MKLLLSVLFSLLIIGSVWAECGTQINSLVPAVVGDSGGLVPVTIRTVPGTGKGYVTVLPQVGSATQDSINQAVTYAYILSNKPKECDVLISFNSNAITVVDGPSAGAALTTAAYAAITNRTLRHDTIITGTIDQFGNVGPVGGLYEKSRSAAQRGAKYFITPTENFYEMLLLKNIESKYGIKILQVKKIDDVIGFMIENRTIEQTNFSARTRGAPNVTAYSGSDINEFIPVAQATIDLEKTTLAKIQATDNETTQIKQFFNNETLRQQQLLDKGYLFTSANEAFLNYIDIDTISVILKGGDPNLAGKKEDIANCINGIKNPVKTDSNFEWVIGADVRENWAIDKTNRTQINGQLLKDEKYIQYNELAYGSAWCEVAKALVNNAPTSGKSINESSWKTLAEQYLAKAKSLSPKAEETNLKLSTAQQEYARGDYGASIYDSTYVIQMENATAELGTQTPAQIDSVITGSLSEKRISLWGRVYQSHAAFIYSQGDKSSAYKLVKFAKGLDSATDDMQKVMTTVTPQQEDNLLWYIVIGAVVLFLFVVLVIVAGRVYGSRGKGTGKTDRTKEKKGRERL
ncbi:hypothetical protein HZC07_03170 [Candidatus Micrarchaeota archaeon]|nr:hypothetical protein [Candidatus Micrarchaeota archaeon]